MLTSIGSFTNAGTITVDSTGGGCSGAPGELVVPAAATLTNTGTLAFSTLSGPGQSTVSGNVDNASSGDISAGGATGTLTGVVTNAGTITAGPGGAIDLTDQLTNYDVSTHALTGGTYRAVGTATSNAEITVNGLASVTDLAATFEIGPGGDISDGTPGSPVALASLATIDPGGVYRVDTGKTATLGPTTNNGTLAIQDGAAVDLPSYTQGANGTLSVQLGPAPTPVLSSTGSVTLAGVLAVSTATGFSPVSGQSFAVATSSASGLTGTFTAVTGPAPGPGLAYQATYTAGSADVVVSSAITDLSATTVISPLSLVDGQPATVTWNVSETGGPIATPAWDDSVYLSSTPSFGPQATLLGRSVHSGGLAAGGGYTGVLSAQVPGLAPGTHYVIVIVDSGAAVADPNRSNNVVVSSLPVSSSVPALGLGGSATVAVPSGGDAYFAVDTSSGPPNLVVTPSAADGTASIYSSFGRIPSAGVHDQAAGVDPNAPLVVSSPQAGVYYLDLHNSGPSASFTLSATAPALLVTSAAPDQLTYFAGSITDLQSNAANRTTYDPLQAVPAIVLIRGAGFQPGTTVQSSCGPATATQYLDPNLIETTLSAPPVSLANYHGSVPQTAPSGTCDVTVTSGGAHVALANGIPFGNAISRNASSTSSPVVGAPVPPPPTQPQLNADVSLVAPSINRPHRDATLFVEYSNPWPYAIPAPLFDVEASGATLHFPGEPDASARTGVNVLGVGQVGSRAELQPGEQETVPVIFDSQLGAHQFVNFTVAEVDDGADGASPVNLADAIGAFIPSTAPAQAVGAVEANLTATGGFTNLASYLTMLDGAASYLDTIGEPSADVGQLLALEMNRATADGAVLSEWQLGAFGYGTPQLTPTATADATGNVTVTDGHGTVEFFKQYDGSFQSGNQTTATLVAVPGGGWTMSDGLGNTSSFTAQGELASVTAADGQTTTNTFDGSGHLTTTSLADGDTQSYTYTPDGRVASVTDPTGRVTTFTYDATGNRLASVTAAGLTTSYTWTGGADPATTNAVASVVNPDGTSQHFAYDAAGNPTVVKDGTGTTVASTTYNADGSLTSAAANGAATTEWEDSSGQMVKVVGPNGQTISYTRNADETVAQLDVNGATSSTTYSLEGQPTSINDPLGNYSQFSYAAGTGTLASATDPLGNQTNSQVDAAGGVTGVSYPDGTSSTATFDAHGDPTTVTDRSGAVSTEHFNGVGLLTGIDLAGGVHLTYGYDAHRNLTTATGPAGVTTFAYNTDDQETSASYPNGQSVSFTYDAGGRRSSETTSDGQTTDYTYDPAGQLATAGPPSAAPTVSYTYNADGTIATAADANGTTTAYTYDKAGLPLSVVTTATGGAVVSSVTYTRDLDERVVTATSPAGTPSAGMTTYTYDNNGDLTEVSLPGGRAISYAYDAAGNRTSVTDSATGTSSYQTNADGAYTSAGSTAATYDGLGRIATSTTGGVTTTYTYDAAGDLASVTRPGHTTTYTYDAMGTPLSQTVDGVTTNLLEDPQTAQLLAANGPTAATSASYTYGNGLVSQDANGNASWFSFDGSGNTTALTDATGTVTDTASYLPFGQVLSSTGSTATPYGFGGAYGIRSDGSGLLQAGVRRLDSATGQFTSPDVAGSPGGNLYAYGDNDPVDYVDPTGFSGESVSGLSRITQTADDLGGALFGPLYTAPHDYVTNQQTGQPQATASTKIGYGLDAVGMTGGNAADLYKVLGQSNGVTNAIGKAAPIATVTSELAQSGTSALNAYYDTSLSTTDRNKAYGDAVRHLVNAPLKLAVAECPFCGLLIDGVESVADTGSNYLFDLAYGNDDPHPELEPGIPPHKGPHNSTTSQSKTPGDPNDMVGPAGYGAAGYVPKSATLPYEVDFTNEATASLPAETVSVTETLSPAVDESTFALGSIGFAKHLVTPPPGLQSWTTTIDDTAVSGYSVRVSADLDRSTRVVTWDFTTIDPATGDTPVDPVAGFLPPDVTSPQGEAFVDYTVDPAASDITGTVVSAAASIVFDTNAAMVTPAAVNTIDAGAPTVTVNPLPTTESGPFEVTWSGGDDPGGSGLAGTTVYVSEDGGSPTPVVEDATGNSAMFTGQVGHAYSFFASGDDHVGNLQSGAASAQAGTVVVAPSSGKGYWLVAADGGVFAYGDAAFAGSAGGTHLNSPVVGMAPTSSGKGYWLVAADGGVFAYGDAAFAGSAGGTHLYSPVVGIEGGASPAGLTPASRTGHGKA
jgi:RHS repeat-associated protein